MRRHPAFSVSMPRSLYRRLSEHMDQIDHATLSADERGAPALLILSADEAADMIRVLRGSLVDRPNASLSRSLDAFERRCARFGGVQVRTRSTRGDVEKHERLSLHAAGELYGNCDCLSTDLEHVLRAVLSDWLRELLADGMTLAEVGRGEIAMLAGDLAFQATGWNPAIPDRRTGDDSGEGGD